MKKILYGGACIIAFLVIGVSFLYMVGRTIVLGPGSDQGVTVPEVIHSDNQEEAPRSNNQEIVGEAPSQDRGTSSGSVPAQDNEVPTQSRTQEIQTLIQGAYTQAQSFNRPGCEGIAVYSRVHRDPENASVYWVDTLRKEGRTEDAERLKELACQPQGIWLVGNDTERIVEKVKRALSNAEGEGSVPLFVLYNVPSRDSLSWGTGLEGESYLASIKSIAEAIGDRRARIVLEPDALPIALTYGWLHKRSRLSELNDAVEVLAEFAPGALLYIDAGHSAWHSAKDTADALTDVGINTADGFSLNVSNFQTTKDQIAYGLAVSDLLDGAHFVIDTSRNGNGAPEDNEWCNPLGRKLGDAPVDLTSTSPLDALLWIKIAGESDGDCNGGTPEGVFWLDYALGLID